MLSPVLAVDIGSTRLKAALVDASGQLLSLAAQDSPLLGAAVLPADVLQAAVQVAQRAGAGQRPGALVVTGATRSTVFAAADGSAQGPLMKLDDGRGAGYATALQAAYGASSPLGLGAFHPLARALDLRDNDPERYRQTAMLLDLKDWVNLQLTGRAACDPVAAARVEPADGGMPALLQQLGLKAGLFPAALRSACILGALQPGTALPDEWHGIPVASCGFDTWAATWGMGCVQAGSVYNVCGTTEVFGSFLPQARDVAGVACLPWSDGIYHLGGPCLTGLGTLAWFGERFLGNADPQAVLECAARAADDVPLCVPFVAGERMPFWRADLAASFIGVRSQHGTPELARALLDGLLVFQRWLLRYLAGQPEKVFLSGGGAGLPGLVQRKASAFGMPVQVPQGEEHGLLGAAMAGHVALGHHADLPAAQRAMGPEVCIVEPDRQDSQRLAALEPRLLPHFPALTG